MKSRALLLAGLAFVMTASATMAQDLEDEARGIARDLQCPVCQGLSVADSPSQLATQMREVIRTRLEAGDSREQILSYFVERYGESVLLSPPRTGFTAVVWITPFLGVAAAAAFVIWAVRRRPIVEDPAPAPDQLSDYLAEVDRGLERLKDQPLR